MGLSPTPHYCTIQGRAAEIARAMGSPVAGAEHPFLGMLHDGGWPVRVLSGLVDLDGAEAAVLRIINGPDYSPPPPPRFPVTDSFVYPWGGQIAARMGDSCIGLEHAFLAMIRMRDTIPARALAGLADLDALEAAVLAAKNAPLGAPADAAFLPDGQMLDGALMSAVAEALPDGATFGFNRDAAGRTWLHVIGPGDHTDPALTRQVLNTALASLDRPALDDE
jgi:Clp amino terminal domain, pathogenicity island component